MMDPFTISTIVVKVAGICLSTAKKLYDIQREYNDAPTQFVTICSESTVISASLSYLQTLVCKKQEFTQTLDSRPELAHVLDAALTGCMVLFSCLEEETCKITAASSKTGAISWKGKVRVIWNHEKLQELLDGLRGQQLAINFLVQLVQVDSLGEIKQLLSQNRPVMTESIRKMKLLKESHPHISVPDSIYDNDDRLSIYTADVSIAGVSAIEFEFDDLIVNSKVYRQVLASAKAKASGKIEDDRGVIEGDLIDLSDVQTIIAVEEKNNIQDLGGLIISHGEESVINNPRTLASYLNDDHKNAITINSPEASGSADIGISNSLVMRSKGPGATALPVFEHAGISSADNGSRGVIQTAELNKKKGERTKFGEYYLGNTIGQGGKSKVKIGWKKENSIQVAIKLIPRKSGQNISVDLFKVFHEVAILQQISHPNVVRLHEMVETERHIGIVLEYASGGDLFEYLRVTRYLKDPAARRPFAQIISGIGYLHSKGIIHRNLDLHKLLLDRNRNIIISGFGSASVLESADELAAEMEYNSSSQEYVRRMGLNTIQPDGSSRGDPMRTKRRAPLFTAPEVVVLNSNLEYVNQKIDVWSCGVVLYAMLAGCEPFDDDPANPDRTNINLLYRNVVTTPLTFPEYVTPFARDLIRRMIVHNPVERATLFEVARHAWLSEYADMVAFIT